MPYIKQLKARYSQKKEMWQLRCQTCGQTFLMDRYKRYVRREGWRTWYYCSKECKEAKGELGDFKPMPAQPEAERKAVIQEVVQDLVKRNRPKWRRL